MVVLAGFAVACAERFRVAEERRIPFGLAVGLHGVFRSDSLAGDRGPPGALSSGFDFLRCFCRGWLAVRTSVCMFLET